MVYLLDEVSNQYHKEISSDVINKYQFKKVDDIVNYFRRIKRDNTKMEVNYEYCDRRNFIGIIQCIYELC